MTSTFEQITNELVKTFRNDERTAEYDAQAERYELFSGWAGFHSPVSRPAFIAAFGTEIVEKAENEAKRIISEDAKNYAASDYMAHVREAEAHKAARLAGDEYECLLIEYRLDDMNFHTEARHLHAGEYGKALEAYADAFAPVQP